MEGREREGIKACKEGKADCCFQGASARERLIPNERKLLSECLSPPSIGVLHASRREQKSRGNLSDRVLWEKAA